MEVWRDVCDFEGYYQVSNMGRVRSLDRYYLCTNGKTGHRRARICSQRCDKDGYFVVKLSKNGISKLFPVHRLVALAFVDGAAEDLEVDHIDSDRQNNEAENLRWVSHANNVDHCLKEGRHVCQTNLTGRNNPNYGNRSLSARYKEDKESARIAQSRPRGRNGRAVPIKLILSQGEVLTFACAVDCVDYLVDNDYLATSNKQYVAHKIIEAAKDSRLYKGLRFAL